jgi:hypothetical protein
MLGLESRKESVELAKVEGRNPAAFAPELQILKLGTTVNGSRSFAYSAINGVMETTRLVSLEECASVLDELCAMRIDPCR